MISEFIFHTIQPNASVARRQMRSFRMAARAIVDDEMRFKMMRPCIAIDMRPAAACRAQGGRQAINTICRSISYANDEGRAWHHRGRPPKAISKCRWRRVWHSGAPSRPASAAEAESAASKKRAHASEERNERQHDAAEVCSANKIRRRMVLLVTNGLTMLIEAT